MTPTQSGVFLAGLSPCSGVETSLGWLALVHILSLLEVRSPVVLAARGSCCGSQF